MSNASTRSSRPGDGDSDSFLDSSYHHIDTYYHIHRSATTSATTLPTDPLLNSPTVSRKQTIGRLNLRAAADHGIIIQILRTILLLAWFASCSVCIVLTQLVGCPLLLIRRRWFDAYIARTKASFGLVITAVTQWGAPTPVRISGDRSVKGQFGLDASGKILKTQFPERLVMIANHQVYTDWMYLWWQAYSSNMHGHIYIILKESLKYIPVLGQGMMFYGFIFMARKWLQDKPRLKHRLEKLRRAYNRGIQGSVFEPMWLLIFPEGTNLSENSKMKSDQYGVKSNLPNFEHVLLPRSTGLFFCLQELRGTVDYLYDCTVGYSGPPKGVYPDKFFTLRSTFLRGCPPASVNFYWRRFAIDELPLDDQEEFGRWLLQRWSEKNDLLEQFYNEGQFPPCDWEEEEELLSHMDSHPSTPGEPSDIYQNSMENSFGLADSSDDEADRSKDGFVVEECRSEITYINGRKMRSRLMTNYGPSYFETEVRLVSQFEVLKIFGIMAVVSAVAWIWIRWFT
ncbi:emp24p/erv25p- protein [Ascosphaera pollenicola]|nr:emp24p/erv25p- protein [Ascosphaera pollenicola]